MNAPGVFFSYSHADESMRDQIEKQLSTLKRQGVIGTWHDRHIKPGNEFAQAIDDHINRDEIILLLVSPDFIASDYCYEIEMQRAMERHETGEAIVIPVILRVCDWHSTPFGKLQAVPRDGKAIKQWPDMDEAMLQVALAVRQAAARWHDPAKGGKANATASPAAAEMQPDRRQIRSSNLRLAKKFTQRDKDQFKDESFEYIAKFIESSLTELAERNPGYEGVFKRVDANRFFATIYKDGNDAARATYFTGGDAFGSGINYTHGETTGSSSTSETLTVEADDQSMFLTSTMMNVSSDREKRLSQDGAAEHMWELLIGPLQRTNR